MPYIFIFFSENKILTIKGWVAGACIPIIFYFQKNTTPKAVFLSEKHYSTFCNKNSIFSLFYENNACYNKPIK